MFCFIISIRDSKFQLILVPRGQILEDGGGVLLGGCGRGDDCRGRGGLSLQQTVRSGALE